MKKYDVKWKSCNVSLQNETCMENIFDDVSFRDMYIRATDDDTKETFYIPYTSIYDIKLLDIDENE